MRVLAAFAAGLLAAGCGAEAANRGPVSTVRDSAGISIAENASPDDSASNTWWRLDGPDLSLGGLDAEEPYALYRVTDALRLDDGRIVVASNGSDDIRFFDATGDHISTHGRTGDGPGEYQNPGALEMGRGDSLLVVDASARRVSVLEPDGEFVRVFDIGQTAVIPRIVGRFADGSLLAAPAMIVGPDPARPRNNEITRPPFTLVRIAPGGEIADTLGEFPGVERVMNVQTNAGEIVSINILMVPFAKSPTFAVHDTEVYVGAQDGPEIRVYGMDGALRRIIRTDRAPEPVTENHLDTRFERQIASMPEERQAEARARGRNTELPHGELVPPYGEIATDHAGNLWVADYDDPTDPPGRWTVYDPDGRALARIVFPESFRPLDIGEGWVLGLELDELDVEYVRLYRITK